jgi:hypothetical protein
MIDLASWLGSRGRLGVIGGDHFEALLDTLMASLCSTLGHCKNNVIGRRAGLTRDTGRHDFSRPFQIGRGYSELRHTPNMQCG